MNWYRCIGCTTLVMDTLDRCPICGTAKEIIVKEVINKDYSIDRFGEPRRKSKVNDHDNEEEE